MQFARSGGFTSPTEAVDALCQQALRRAGEGDSLPVDIERVAQSLDAVCERTDRGPAGTLTTAGGRFLIRYRGDLPYIRQRFTIGHEIGHLLILRALSGDRQSLRNVIGHTEPGVERLCDRAAGRLLMPQTLVKGLVSQSTSRLSGTTLRLAARKCRVSLEALVVEVARVHDWRLLHGSLWNYDVPRERYALTKNIPSRSWIPTGVSVRRVEPDLITEAVGIDRASVGSVAIEVRPGLGVRGAGVALRIDREDSGPRLPFSGPTVLRDPYPSVLLLICETDDVGSRDTAGARQLALPLDERADSSARTGEAEAALA